MLQDIPPLGRLVNSAQSQELQKSLENPVNENNPWQGTDILSNLAYLSIHDTAKEPS